MSDTVFKSFLEEQYREALALAANSDVLRLQPAGGQPPEAYVAVLDCPGLVRRPDGRIVEYPRCVYGIRFPPDYLRMVHPGHVLSLLDPPECFHPNIRAPLVCAYIAPGTPLSRLLRLAFELWTWRVRQAAHGLNEDAMQWYRRQKDNARFPIFKGALLRSPTQHAGRGGGD